MAARGGHLDVLKYARENGCLWDVSSLCRSMCINAVIGGNVECLKYVREHKCPMDSRTCDKAAEYGRLEMLKYLRSLGCKHTVTLKVSKVSLFRG
jgi:hypothetical protein